MELTLSAADGTDLGSTSDFVLDLSFGDSGNNYTLSCPSLPIACGDVVAVDGTEWGGLVDSCEDALESGVSTTTWSGRTFHGLLCGKVLCPPAGQDYLTASGDANDCLRSLVARCGLSDFFEVPAAKAGIDVRYTFDRYCDAYTGIRKMLASSSARLMIRREDGRTLMWAEAAEAHGDGIDSDLLDFSAKRATRPVNHLVCAGTGELHERVVVHLYADEAGNVSRTQTLKGSDEVCELYEYSSADEAKLVEDGTKKLKGYQSQGSVDVTVHDGLTLYVGDTVTAANREVGRTVTATVGKKIVKVSGGIAAISYEVGDAETSATGGTSAGHESSGGGVSYAAGEGIRITGGTISAEVTQAGLDAVSAAVSKASESAQGVANDLAAETARATKAEDAATSDRAAIRAEFADADKAETTRAKAAEKANADAVANEAKARDAADAALGKRIDAALKVFTSTARTNVIDKALTLDMVKDVFDHSIVIANQLRLMPFWTDGKTVAIYTGNRENTSGHPYATVRADGTRYGETFPKWSELTGKPFSAIGDGLTVTNGTLSADVKAAPIQAVTATAPITATAKDGTVTIATDGTLATVEGVASEAKSRADADSALAKRVTAAENALAKKPDAASTSLSYRFKLDCGKGKYWFRLGTLVSAGDDSSVHIHVRTGNGFNGFPSQNSDFWVFIKDGFADSAKPTYLGTTVDLGANCKGVEVRVYAANGSTADVWVKLPWEFPNGNYTIQGVYKSWTPNTKRDNQADAPALGSMIDQNVAYRTIASTDYVMAKLAGYQPRGDYAAKSHQHAASDVTSGVLPVARGGTGNGSGNAPTASRLASAHTITLKGAVTGSAKFDGSADVTITCEGQGAAASFLAAHPVGSVYVTNSTTNPAGAYGGTWARVPYMDGVAWRRTA